MFTVNTNNQSQDSSTALEHAQHGLVTKRRAGLIAILGLGGLMLCAKPTLAFDCTSQGMKSARETLTDDELKEHETKCKDEKAKASQPAPAAEEPKPATQSDKGKDKTSKPAAPATETSKPATQSDKGKDKTNEEKLAQIIEQKVAEKIAQLESAKAMREQQEKEEAEKKKKAETWSMLDGIEKHVSYVALMGALITLFIRDRKRVAREKFLARQASKNGTLKP